jgi:hypothetical protein
MIKYRVCGDYDVNMSLVRLFSRHLIARSTSTLSATPLNRVRLATTMSNPPAGVTTACCEPPAVVRLRDDYELKGSYKPYGIFEKAYITGPDDTNKAVIFVCVLTDRCTSRQHMPRLIAHISSQWIS